MFKERFQAPRMADAYAENYVDGVFVDTTHNPSLDPPASSEFISYTNGRNRMNSCSHQKYNWTFHGPSKIRWSITDHPTTYSDGSNGFHYRSEPGSMHPSPPGAAPPPNGEFEFLKRGYQNIRPKFKGLTSIPNFLFELKDLKHTLPTPKRIREIADALSGVRWNPFTKKGAKLTNELLDEAAAQHLSANFGYLPLIDDIFNILINVENYNDKIREFKKFSGATQTGHYKEVVAAVTHPPSFVSGEFYWKVDQQDSISDVEYAMTLKYKYFLQIEEINTPWTAIQFAGFRANPRVIWDAIPFSFMIDWVLRMGKYLESFDDGALPVSLVIVGVALTKSYSAVRKFHISPITGQSYTMGVSENTLLSQEGWEVYDRRIISPRDTDLQGLPPLPVFDHLSVNEIILAGALAKTLSR